MKATWKKGYHAKINADVAYNELNKIKESNGGVLTAGVVLHKAKSKRNKLHKAFEWNDEKAADEFRMNQARNLIGSIEVIYAESSTQKHQRVFVTVTEPAVNNNASRRVYKTVKEVLENPIERDELLSKAINDALTYRKKYSQLSELAGVFSAMDNFVVNFKTARN